MIGAVAKHADASAFSEPALDVGLEVPRDDRIVLTGISRPLVDDRRGRCGS